MLHLGPSDYGVVPFQHLLAFISGSNPGPLMDADETLIGEPISPLHVTYPNRSHLYLA